MSRKCSDKHPCGDCRADQAFLRSRERPSVPVGGPQITVVDLFASCGGMTVGLDLAARASGSTLRTALAVDSDSEALDIYKANFPDAQTRCAAVESVFTGAIGAPLAVGEKQLRKAITDLDILVGGPPCQGHSDLNNHTRRADPKNQLLVLMARAAEVLSPQIVVIENVATAKHDRHKVVDQTTKALEGLGYTVATDVLDLGLLGVPQRRRRLLLIASQLPDVTPLSLFTAVRNALPGHRRRTVRWAIDDLKAAKSDSTFDSASRQNKDSKRRIGHLFDKGFYDLPNRYRPICHRDGKHSYTSMYGRLHWGQAAQTITTGFGSMGQGRYVHPERRRTLTPHEAARLQTFPDWFDFGKARRGVLATAIGNAVPPLLMKSIGTRIIPAIIKSHAARLAKGA